MSDLIGINDATQRFFGPTVSTFTVRRWIVKGLGTPPVRLKARRIGGRWFLRPADVHEFIGKTADPDLFRKRPHLGQRAVRRGQ